MGVIFNFWFILFLLRWLSLDQSNQSLKNFFLSLRLNSFQKPFFKSFFSILLRFTIFIIHPIKISNFFKYISHILLKILKISLIVYPLFINSIFDLIDKSHYQVIVIPIIPVFKLHITWHDVIIRQSFDIVNFIHQLFQLFVHLRTLLLGIFRSYVVKNFVLNVTVQLLEFVIV